MADDNNTDDTNTVANGNNISNTNTKMNSEEDDLQQHPVDKEFQIREAVRLKMEQKLQEELKKIREKVSSFLDSFDGFFGKLLMFFF